MAVLTLFGTQVCALCDEAKALIYSVIDGSHHTLVEEDILLVDGLFDRYKHSIPVIRYGETEHELFWPFEPSELIGWLELMATKTSERD